MAIEKIKTLPVTSKQREKLIKAIEKTKEQIHSFDKIIEECRNERLDSMRLLAELLLILETGYFYIKDTPSGGDK